VRSWPKSYRDWPGLVLRVGSRRSSPSSAARVGLSAVPRFPYHPAAMTDQHDHRPPAEPPTLGGQPYPLGRIVAVIDDEPRAEAAIADLEASGVPPESIWRASGAEIAEMVEARSAHESALHRFIAGISLLLSDDARIQDYLELAGRSGRVLVVPAEGRRDEIKGILARHGAHDMRYFGRLVTEDLI
jgi:hypothetical protein